MELFSAEYAVPVALAISRRTCQIGDNIWIIQDSGGDDYEILKYDTKQKKCEKVEYTNKTPIDYETEHQMFGDDRKFDVFTSNDKIYMKRMQIDRPRHSRLIEFNTSTLQLRYYEDIQPPPNGVYWHDPEWFINGDTIFYVASSGGVKVINKYAEDERITIYPFPDDGEQREKKRIYNICELNASIYLVRTAYPSKKTVLCYDANNSKFELCLSEVELPWGERPWEQYQFYFKYVQSSVWTGDNEIYHAFNCNNIKIVIDCFEIQNKEWSTIFQYKFEENMLPIRQFDYFANICGSDKSAYVIVDNMMELVIREIGKPRLEAICLHSLVASEAVKSKDSTSSTIELPIPLREPFAELLARKTGEKRLERLEYYLNMIEKFEVEKENVAIMANGDIHFRNGFARAWMFWSMLETRQCLQKFFFRELRSDLKKKLEQAGCKKMRLDEQVQRNIDAQKSKFDELVQRYDTELEPRIMTSRNYHRFIEKYRRES